MIPPADKVTAFLESKDPSKRSKVIDELLADPRYGEHLAEVFIGLMVPRESNNRRLDHKPLQNWLAEGFNKNTPVNQQVFDLLTSTGELGTNPAVGYFVANPTVDKITDSVSRMFLGVQLQCAQCHNHPFTDYKQNEYWGMAAFFTKVQMNANPQAAAKKGVTVSVFESKTPGKGRKLPEGGKVVPAKFLQGDSPKIAVSEPSRPVLAKWLTSAENPFFAKAMVNRVWHQAFGRGLVNPVDDMHEDNPATHPELLAAMAEQFKRSDFDLKYLVRAIYNSDTYQRTSRPTEENKADTVCYSHRLVRVLTPEQFYDSIIVALGRNAEKRANVEPKRGPPITGRDNFTNFFRIEEGANALEYQIGIPQALRLMNAPQMNNTVDTVKRAVAGTKSPAEAIERLFLQTLSRRPTAREVERFTAHVAQASSPQTGYGDVLWALMNSSEFAFNH